MHMLTAVLWLRFFQCLIVSSLARVRVGVSVLDWVWTVPPPPATALPLCLR